MKIHIGSALILRLVAPIAVSGTLFVDANLTTGAADGSSWTDAFRWTHGLQHALAPAVSGDQLFVAQEP